ncbi:MAG: hypothetical protein M3Q39_01305 [Actinomycetota bacterium]|nr:hypothetical protein [Actinomycetota bacterium]
MTTTRMTTTRMTTMIPTRGAVALAAAELRLLVRNRLLAFTALVMPLLLGGFLGFSTASLGPEGTPALQIAVVLAIAVYAGATTSLTARRQDRYLKRLAAGSSVTRPCSPGYWRRCSCWAWRRPWCSPRRWSRSAARCRPNRCWWASGS